MSVSDWLGTNISKEGTTQTMLVRMRDGRMKEKRRRKEKKEYGEDVDDIPNTMEYEAHSVIRPTVQKRFETLLDSLSAPILAESLFQNQQ